MPIITFYLHHEHRRGKFGIQEFQQDKHLIAHEIEFSKTSERYSVFLVFDLLSSILTVFKQRFFKERTSIQSILGEVS